MSEEKKRVELTDEQVGEVAGGNIQYVVRTGMVYAYGSHNPDKKYGFSNLKAFVKFATDNYDLYGEAGTLLAAVDAGLAWPL